jgi:hypothetical protein
MYGMHDALCTKLPGRHVTILYRPHRTVVISFYNCIRTITFTIVRVLLSFMLSLDLPDDWVFFESQLLVQ